MNDLGDRNELRAQLPPRRRNLLEEKIKEARDVSSPKYKEAARSFWLIRLLIARGKEVSLEADHPKNVESLLTFLGDDQGIKSSGYTSAEQEYAV